MRKEKIFRKEKFDIVSQIGSKQKEPVDEKSNGKGLVKNKRVNVVFVAAECLNMMRK